MPIANNLAAIRIAFETLGGVEFIAEDAYGGVGVRLRKILT